MNYFKEYGSHYKALIFNFDGGESMRLAVNAPPEEGDIVLTRLQGDIFKCESCSQLLTIGDDDAVKSVGRTHAVTHAQ